MAKVFIKQNKFRFALYYSYKFKFATIPVQNPNLLFMLIRFAIKNIRRHFVRSLLIVSILWLAIGLSGMMMSFIQGLNQQRLLERLNNSLGHIKITHQDFDQEKIIQKYFPFDSTALHSLHHYPWLLSFNLRLNTFGMIQSRNRQAQFADIYGIDVQREKSVLNLYRFIAKGRYLNSGKEIVIGQELANELDVKLDDKLILTFNSTISTLCSDTLKIVGIYQIQNKAFESTHIFMPIAAMRTMAGLPESVYHQILLKTQKPEQALAFAQELKRDFPSLKVQSWVQISPDLAFVNEIMRYFFAIFTAVIFLVCGMMIYNIFMLTITERRTELQMLQTIGMLPNQIFSLLWWENTLLMGMGASLGLASWLGFVWFFQKDGISLDRFALGMQKAGYASAVYPLVNYYELITLLILLLIAGWMTTWRVFKILKIK
jgi:putative ABC transport system permease protein